MPLASPTETTRWRCTACGNLTRFDVVRTTRTREFVHADLSGEMAVEEREVLSDVVERVTCRWCNGVDTVELIARPHVDAAAAEGPAPTGTAATGSAAVGPAEAADVGPREGRAGEAPAR